MLLLFFFVFSLLVEYTIECSLDYYGSYCNVKCLPSDNNQYVCNTTSGKKICRKG